MSGRRDLVAGLFFLAFGLLLIALSLQYSTFAFRNLGPGFLPLMYAAGIALCGAILTAQGIVVPTVEVDPLQLRGLVFVTAAILFFACFINSAGLFIAGAGTVLLAACAGGDFRWKEVGVLTVGILICAWLLFVRALGLPIMTFPEILVVLENLILGLSVAVTPENLFFCFVGALIGTLVGVLPGLGPVTTMAMLLPLTYYLSPVSALIMLAGIYYGAQYGGSTTAILVNLPGEASSVVTCLDGYRMARQGRAGAALAVAALGSFFAGTVATFFIVFFSPMLAQMAQSFSAGNYFALMTFGLITAIVLARGSPIKAILMVLLGLFLASIGTDVNTGLQRFTFGIPQLYDGINFVALGMGLFGIAEIIKNLEAVTVNTVSAKIGGLWLTREEFQRSWPAVLRGTALGSLLGILPGGGGLLASFASYTLEKKLSKDPSRFGNGAIEGVAAPESANNAGAQTSFIPLLTLGIPSNVVMAMMVGAMTIHGIIPGPEIMTKQPNLFWGMIASMWVGNLMLVIINLPLIGVWVALLRVHYRFLFPTIIFICCIGVFSINSSYFDLLMMAGFGIVGYVLIKFGFEPAPLLLGFILGPMMEENLRRALLLSRGSGWVLLTDPVSATMLGLSASLLLSLILPSIRRKREETFAE